jgi:glucokinase
LSGAGLVNLYHALSEIAGAAAADYTPAEVTAHALDQTDARCVAAFGHFCTMLGTVAGNLALTFGATGGIYLAGGILPRFKEALTLSGFRARFEAKGRMTEYLRRIPTLLILNEEPALLGLANLTDHR